MSMSLLYRSRSNGRTICSRKPTFRRCKDGPRVVLNQREKNIVLGHDRLFYLVGFWMASLQLFCQSHGSWTEADIVHSSVFRKRPTRKDKPNFVLFSRTFLDRVRWDHRLLTYVPVRTSTYQYVPVRTLIPGTATVCLYVQRISQPELK
jgi:hypothetical protein